MRAYSEEAYHAVIRFRDAALADGWTSEPMYQHEPKAYAAVLRRDGFTAQAITRPRFPQSGAFMERTHPYGSFALWGPDNLMIPVPATYDWAAIQAGVRICPTCKAQDVETFRYAFAGRACASCLPALKAVHEKPGWTD